MRKFIGIAGVTLAGAAGAIYLLADTHSVTRKDIQPQPSIKTPLRPEIFGN